MFKKKSILGSYAFMFNNLSETECRTVKQLKTVYDMTKRQVKKSLSNDKVDVFFNLYLFVIKNVMLSYAHIAIGIDEQNF